MELTTDRPKDSSSCSHTRLIQCKCVERSDTRRDGRDGLGVESLVLITLSTQHEYLGDFLILFS